MKYLKLSIAILLVLISAIPGFAEVPKLIEYTGRLEKLSGAPYPSGIYDITFQFCTDEACNTSLWSETHTLEISARNKKVIDGGAGYEAKFSVILGSITPLDSLAFDVDYYLKVTEDTLGFSMVEQIATASYAMRSDFANYAETAYDSNEGTYKDVKAIKVSNAFEADNANTVDGKHYSEIATEIDGDIAIHEAISDAHHTKTTSFAELTDTATDAQIPDDITVNEAKRIRALPGAPATPLEGEVYFDTILKMAYIWDGSQWNEYRGPQGPQGPPGPEGPSKLPYYASVQDIPSSASLGTTIVCGANSKYSSSPYHCNSITLNKCPSDGDGPYSDQLLVYLEKYYPHLGGYIIGWWCVGGRPSNSSYPLIISEDGPSWCSFGRCKYPKLMVNGNNQTGGGIAVSDDGGFFDWNDGWITYEPLCCEGGLRVRSNLSVTGGKWFEIDHPTKPGYKLIHASLEGPEQAVYYRGTGQLVNGQAQITLPEYFDALTIDNTTTILLTPKGKVPFLLSYDDFNETSFIVYGSVENGSFDWEAKAVRADLEPLEVEQLPTEEPV